MLKQLTTAGLAALTAAGSIVGVRAGTEEPKFQVVERIGEVEIRRYGERVAAETEVTGSDEQGRSDGFRRLAGYIFGANLKNASIAMTAPVEQKSEKIAMTAPVAQVPEGAGVWRIQFYMPSQYKLADLPTPKDSAVHLTVVPPATYAVLVFSGLPSSELMKAKQKELLAKLSGTNWRPSGDLMKAKQKELLAKLSGTNWRASGEPVNWFYDPPWTLPPLRRNEVAVPVTSAR